MLTFELKLERAVEQSRELLEEFSAFQSTSPFAVDVGFEDSTNEWVYRLSKAGPFPPEFALRLGEIIQSSRSALDYLAYALVDANGGDSAKGRSTAFPFCTTIEAYESQKNRALKGMSDEAIETIAKFQPFNGNNCLAALHALSNIDKHRRILLTTVRTYSFTIETDRMLQLARAGYYPVLPSGEIKVGDELLRFPKHVLPRETDYWQWDIAINEPGIFQHKPVISSINHIINHVHTALVELKSFT